MVPVAFLIIRQGAQSSHVQGFCQRAGMLICSVSKPCLIEGRICPLDLKESKSKAERAEAALVLPGRSVGLGRISTT